MKGSFVTPSITRMYYSWSKYGEQRFGYGIGREFSEEWSCQLCGEKQIIGLPKYFFPIDETMLEFLVICPSCKADIKKSGVKNLNELLEEIKDLENYRKKIKNERDKIELELKTPTGNKL